MCNTRQVIASLIQAVSFLQLLHGSLRPAGKHSCGKARQQGVNTLMGMSNLLTETSNTLTETRNVLTLSGP